MKTRDPQRWLWRFERWGRFGTGGRLRRWPYIHFCPLDLWCWYCFFAFGSPLRLHYRDRFWEIPGLYRWANWISDRRWDWDHPVERTEGKDFS